MTAAQERRLLLAAIGFASADAALQIVRRKHRSGETPDPEGRARVVASKLRREWKTRLLAAAGTRRKQPLLPIERVGVRITEAP
jgi:hypothetical protein